MKILLAVDGSSFGDAAVAEVARRPWPQNSEVKVISVVEPPLIPTVETWALPENFYEELENAGRQQALRYLERAVEVLKPSGITLSTEVLKGHPKQAILDFSEEWLADLIVVGSHGYRGLSRLLLGSVSQAVASQANCSVEIVRVREAKK